MIVRKPSWRMGTLVALDPGSNKAGLAIFRNNKLEWAGAIINPAKSKGAKGWEEMARLAMKHTAGCDVYVFEKMFSYGLEHQKGSQNDLMELIGMAAWLGGLLEAPEVCDPYPAEWKGQLKKEICHARALDALSLEEKGRIDTKPAIAKLDVLDAVALGLFALRRT